ncbi:hypothetical protein PACTADRAFT_1492 [Pachysolen tannophilus NRRL Y-2460]|uniref:TOG domain-containing protein n=1 Tax=Pachysolen tannophilus NRRL Y-2460 TaxID=669874 RepID=A0A1E4TZ05_PACTA|nr:hypothetical protein PACTADRAFT_1492 [Pachysolen tannophilus NRRL Y-2460]
MWLDVQSMTWDKLSLDLEKLMANSLLSVRIPTLKKLKSFISQGYIKQDSDLNEISIQLLKTFYYYQDQASRRLVIEIFDAILDKNFKFLVEYIQFISRLVLENKSLAVKDYLTLLEWCNHFLIALNSTEKFFLIQKIDSDFFSKLVHSQTFLLDSCLQYGIGLENVVTDSKKPPYQIPTTNTTTTTTTTAGNFNSPKLHRKRVYESALSQTKLAIAKFLNSNSTSSSTTLLEQYLENILTQSGTSNTSILTMIGILSSAIVDLIPQNPRLYDTFSSEAIVDKVVTFFCQKILMDKIPPQQYSLVAFQDFTGFFINQEIFGIKILPSLEKSILRSPELSLGHITKNFFDSLPPIIDLSQYLDNGKLLSQLLSSFKSSSELIRRGALTTMESILTKHCNEATPEILIKISDQVFNSLKSVTSNDQRQLFAKTLEFINSKDEKVTLRILNGLVSFVTKDQNETSLRKYVDTFIHKYYICLYNEWATKGSTIDIDFLKVIKNGLSDKKWNFRKAWFIAIAYFLLNFDSDQFNSKFVEFFESIFPLLAKTLDEIITAPIATTLANKSIECAYVVVFLSNFVQNWPNNSELKKIIENEQIFAKALKNSDDTKPSIILNHRIYSKLTTLEEQTWFLRAIYSLLSNVKENQLDYGNSWLYLTLSQKIPNPLRREAIKYLEECYLTRQELFGDLMITSLTTKLNTEIEEGEDDLNLIPRHIPSVLSGITQSALTDKKILSKHVSDLLLLAHHEKIPIKNGWVGLALRSRLDPGEIVDNYTDKIISNLCNVLLDENFSKAFHKAAAEAITTVVFILPNKVSPILKNIISDDLKTSRVENYIDETNLKIWKAKDGELVVDVLSKATSKPKYADKNSKDYETRKWEESIRNEIANKKNLANSNGSIKKKLSKEEQILVNEQLLKEYEIRSKIQENYIHLRRGIEICRSLASINVDSGSQHWFPIAVSSLLTISQKPQTSLLLGSSVNDAFLALSNVISPRLGLNKLFLGLATLRINGVTNLQEYYLEEPLLDLISRVLYRVKFLSDQRPLDSMSLIYILPLLIRVLEIGKEISIKNSQKQITKAEFVEEEKEEEQLYLSLEIISTHNEVFQDESIPRKAILDVLLSLMALASKAKIAKECFKSICQVISINPSKSDLSIIIDGCINHDAFVRNSVLEVLDTEFDLSAEMTYSNELWIACHDNNENNASIALTIWKESNFKLDETSTTQLIQYLGSKDSGLRLSVAKAISEATKLIGTVFDKTLDALLEYYRFYEKPEPPKLDEFGLVIQSSISDQKDRWEERSGVALSLKFLSPLFKDTSSVVKVFEFLIVEKALGDKEPIVRQELQEAGIEVINLNGFKNIESLVPIFEACLSEKDVGSKVQDNIRESVIILYGALARHLDSSDPRLTKIIDRLIKTLDTPSEDVQFAVSECISPLVEAIESKLSYYFESLFKKLFEGKNLAQRRGAAYGIAGLVKGMGIKALANNDIIRILVDAAEDKKDPKKREGVSFAFECLSQSLGKFFEPYVIEILPIILKQLGDMSPEVRDATDYATRVIMKNTTSYGVKKLIPLAIENLDEIAWRSKKGSVELLGSMAYLDPTQLSSSLSTIVPEIVGVLNDSHKEVRKAADQALKRFGDVIRNPEIQTLVPILIRAIGDPTKYTDEALDALIKTQFVHYIDGPSLALIIHVIHRGMHDRSASTKRKACQIVGNMAILVDSKDLIQYLPSLISELEISMVDPVPSTRATAARALGSLVEKLGEEQFPDLIPRLLSTLQDEDKSGDRLGSAQALSEVISGLGVSKLEEMLPTIISGASSTRAYVRAGFMPLLLFLPVCFGSQFSPYLSKVIPVILAGLADTDVDIRETSLKSARLIVKNYARKAVDLLLPELENGLSDTSYRIRLSSVELTGDLLFQVTGISGRNELSENQPDASGEVNNNLLDVLGRERRDRILSSLFVCRQDTSGLVRSATVDIWKALVANTPRTIKEILPTLTEIIIRRLASSDETQRNIAAQTLGELVRRVGGNALSELLPTLEDQLVSSDVDAKQGICIAIHELIESSSEETIREYQDIFIRIVRSALVDSNESVREAAALAFDVLQDSIGNTAVDEIIPNLLNMLNSAESDNALSALQEIMSKKSDVIFPILIPSLLSPPIDAFKAGALSSLAEVAGSALYKRLSSIINALVGRLIDSDENDKESADIKASFDKILLSVDSEEGLHPLLIQILSLIKNEDLRKRAVMFERLGPFFSETTVDYSIYTADIVSQCIMTLDDTNPNVVMSCWTALSELLKKQSKESLEKLVRPAYESLAMTGSPGKNLAGFSLPKGPNCVLPIFLHGLMYGNSDQREVSAMAIADIVEKTPAENLKPFVTVMVGPLIRVIGERFSSDIKAAILYALNMLFSKIPQFLRPFIPQLQRTFVKSLSDPSHDLLRSRAAKALGTLIEYQPRVDPLVTELVGGAKQAAEDGVKTAMLKALLEVVNKAGSKMSENSKNSVMNLVKDDISEASDNMAVAYARLVGSLSKILTHDEATKVLKEKVLDASLSDDSGKFAILTLNAFLKDSPSHIFETNLVEQIGFFIKTACLDEAGYISDNAVVAAAKFLLLYGETKSPDSIETKGALPFTIPDDVVRQIVEALSITACKPVSNSLDTRRLSLVVIRTLARFKYEDIIKPNITNLALSVFTCVRDIIIPIKLAAEKAYLAIFNMVEDEKSDFFNSWFSELSSSVNGSTVTSITGQVIQLRSIGDYTKRVSSRLAAVERERISAGGDIETMFSDRFEDEKEIWAVGGVELTAK